MDFLQLFFRGLPPAPTATVVACYSLTGWRIASLTNNETHIRHKHKVCIFPVHHYRRLSAAPKPSFDVPLLLCNPSPSSFGLRYAGMPTCIQLPGEGSGLR